jgi:tRNA A-37 threonylcarbamoyl transferase component Bud32
MHDETHAMTDCPEHDTLRRYLAGSLEVERRRQVGQHVENCYPCQAAIGDINMASRLTELTSTEVAAPRSPADDEMPAVPGCILTGLLGKGGMGAVYLGHDERLNRDVAVKIMRADLCRRPDLERRFLEEAQIASQLQHPGIPPVHALGTLADGRPYFVMKVVKGRTLAELLHERSGPPGDLARWLPIFEQVCQAVAYAHSKGVIHRDLKPHNVMVGAFGEVQVMDWGLAKILARGRLREDARDQEGSVVEASPARPENHRTQAGSILGTWAYMPPEQARGDVSSLACQSDVFGLGAILCELLTTSPPYGGPGEGLKDHARQAHLSPAYERLASCGADDELVRLARSCLSEDPGERPPDAGTVALFVAAYRRGVQERLHEAEVERAAQSARAEEAQVRLAVERRLRRLVVGLTAVGVTVLVFAFAAAVVALLASRTGTDNSPVEPRAEDVRARVVSGRAALADEKFALAAEEFGTARDLLARSPGTLPRDQARELEQLYRQASLLSDLLHESLDDVLRLAAGLREPEWGRQFERRYQGHAVIFDDVLQRDAFGRLCLAVYEVRAPGERARLDLDGLGLLRGLPLELPHRLLFGARLAAVEREPPPGRWVIRFEPNSGVLVTDESVAGACLPRPLDADLMVVLKRQATWAEALP